MAGDPLMLLADEPTGNLDSKNGDAVMELLRELHARRRHHLHGHPQPRVRQQATRSINLFDGRVVDDTRSLAPAARLQESRP